jgi:glutaredoxin
MSLTVGQEMSLIFRSGASERKDQDEALRLLGKFSLPGGHPCHKAHRALKHVGYEPEVIRSYGSTMLPDSVNRTEGRREAKRLTGKTTVPVLVTDGGEVLLSPTTSLVGLWSTLPGERQRLRPPPSRRLASKPTGAGRKCSQA